YRSGQIICQNRADRSLVNNIPQKTPRVGAGTSSQPLSARGESVPVVRPRPLVVVQVVPEADRSEGKPEVVEDDVQAVSPPRLTRHVEIVEDDLEVDADLETDLAFSQ